MLLIVSYLIFVGTYSVFEFLAWLLVNHYLLDKDHDYESVFESGSTAFELISLLIFYGKRQSLNKTVENSHWLHW